MAAMGGVSLKTVKEVSKLTGTFVKQVIDAYIERL